MLELYHYDRSTAAQKVRIALAEKGIEVPSENIDLAKSENPYCAR